MKIIKTILCVSLALSAVSSILLLSSCNDDEDGQQKVFELEVTSDYVTDERDNVIIISNTNGEPLASASFENGVILELLADRSKVTDLINVTLITHFPAFISATDRDYYYFYTYTNIEVGDKWFLKRLPSLPETNAGDVTLNLSNLPNDDYDIAISSFKRRNGVIGEIGGPTANLVVNLRESPSDLFLSVTGTDSRFFKTDAASADQEFNLDFTIDFQAFDNIIPIQFSSFDFSGSIRGHSTPLEETNNTNINYHEQTLYNGNTSQLQMGFNDGYSFYITNWSGTISGKRFGYYKLGDAPTEASFQPMSELNFEVTNKAFNAVSFTTASQFVYCLNEWFSIDEISENFPVVLWQVARPMGSQTAVLTSIPAEVIEQHPYLEAVLNLVRYRRSTFVKNINGVSYENYIDDQLGTSSFELHPREWVSVSR